MSGPLNLDANLAQADDFYEALIKAHRNLSEAQSAAFNARLILVLSNHIGDLNVLVQALAVAAKHDSKTT